MTWRVWPRREPLTHAEMLARMDALLHSQADRLLPPRLTCAGDPSRHRLANRIDSAWLNLQVTVDRKGIANG